MTDEQIIKALECCKTDNVKECDDCPYNEKETKTYCVNDLIKDALDLINRQKAEIERLSHECEDCAGCTEWNCECSNIINAYFDEVKKRCIESGIYPVIVKNIMEDVRKEMVGESK